MVTDVEGPSAPLITNLTCKDEHSIYLQWDRPNIVYKNIDYYFISYRSEEKWQFEEIVVERNGSKPAGSKVERTIRLKINRALTRSTTEQSPLQH